MYTKEEASALRQSFWIAYGKYMSPIPGASGGKVNWVNYKTGNKHVKFRMDVFPRSAFCRIEITGEPETRLAILQAFSTLSFSFVLNNVEEDNVVNDFGITISCISTTIEDVSVFKKEKWPEAISFLKNNVIYFDQFWSEHHDIIDMIS